MLTIEVLIAMLILFIVVVTVTTSLKFFNTTSKQRERYENSYITLLNIKDFISPTICQKDILEKYGELNDYQFQAKCKLVKRLNEYKIAFDIDEESGNFGNRIVRLYLVDLNISKGNFKKSLKYYITRESY